MARAGAWGTILILLGALALGQAPGARITYTRSFKASDPAFLSVTVAQNGAASFTAREHDGDAPVTLHFTAAPATVRTLFAEADALHDFGGEKLQSRDKVAYTGDKALAYDDASQHQFQEFTYTKLAPARRLIDSFEKIATTGISAVHLARAMQFDKLDVLDTMQRIQDDWSMHALGEPQLLVPTLQKLAGDSSQMNAARHRAEKLLAAMPAVAAPPAGVQK